MQANSLGQLATRVMLPCRPQQWHPSLPSDLEPVLGIKGVPYGMATQFMAAAPRQMLSVGVFTAGDRAREVAAAQNCLFQGV